MEKHLVWIDLEMTGVDPARDVILEIATIVTDNDLNLVAEGPNIAINQPEDILSRMDDWCTAQHRASGLIERSKASPFTCLEAEQRTLKFLRSHCDRGECPLCGNSVWQDRRFIAKYMASLSEFLHYRNIDVSSIKELAKRWYPSLPPFQKEKSHQALMDIQESVNELKYYRENIFVKIL